MSDSTRWTRTPRGAFALLLAQRAAVLACLIGVAALGLYVSPRRAQLEVKRALHERQPRIDEQLCPATDTREEAIIQDRELDEVSGMVASRKQPGLLWVHNDSGDDARIFAIDRAGQLRVRVRLEGVKARDFEDIALLARVGKPDLLVIADTGDNLARRESVRLLRLPEPHVPPSGEPLELVSNVERVELRYEGGAADVETLLIDPLDGDMYLVGKSRMYASEDGIGVWRVPASAFEESEPLTVPKVASVPLGPATAGDVSPDGRQVAIRNYWGVYLWSIAPGEQLIDAIVKSFCRLPTRDTYTQGESFAFLLDGSGYLTTSEGERAAILVHEFHRSARR